MVREGLKWGNTSLLQHVFVLQSQKNHMLKVVEVNQRIVIPEDELADFCRAHHIRKLALFGSVLRDDFRDDSDIDVLVEFEPGAIIDLFDIVEMEMTLSEMLGRKIDLRTPQDLSRYFRQRVIDTAEILYER